MTAQAQPVVRGEASEIENLIQTGAFRDALELCARQYGASVGRLCIALLSSQQEAEEAAQETLLAAYGSMPTYRGEGSVKSWVYGIARRICARRLETRIRRERRLVLVHDAQGDSTLPDEIVEAKRRADRVRVLLDRLKPTEREALLLRYEADLNHREIGQACGIDEATARKRVSRALERLSALAGQEKGT